MPELPDVTIYCEAIAARAKGHALDAVRLASPFLLRTVTPPLSSVNGKKVRAVSRLGKRIVLALDDDLFLVVHLMVAGRLHWKDEPKAKIHGKIGLAAFDFAHGTLLFTEAGTKKRASLHVVQGKESLKEHERGGQEPLAIDLAAFRAVLVKERHTIKRTLTDPRLFSGIGNAYSDEILWEAQLSPVVMSTSLDDDASARLYRATQKVLTEWTERLRAEADGGFPEKVTAFRAEMAVHGKHGEPCPRCQAPVQRIAHADNETNYCAPCQTDGKLLKDRALSRLLGEDWPRSLDELEAMKEAHRAR